MIKRTLEERSRQQPKHLKVIPGKVIVRWKQDVVRAGSAGSARRSAKTVAHELPDQVKDRLRFLRDNHGLKHVVDVSAAPPTAPRRQAARAGVERHTELVARSLTSTRQGLRGTTLLEFGPKADLAAIARALRGGAVLNAYPAPARWLAAAKKKAPSDEQYLGQWGLVAVRWPQASRPSAGSIKVAVLDSGVDRTHPDLKKSITAYDHGRFKAADLEGHGTHVAGIIAAVANNRIGIAGVANCRLRCWKVFSDEPDEDDELYLDNEAYYSALEEVARQGDVKVINLSLGGIVEDPTENDLIASIVARDNKLVVAAMGNEFEEGNPREFPACLPGVLAVGAITPNRRRAPYSNTGQHIGLVAPGDEILSTVPLRASEFRDDVEYASWSGTSMATPFVSGAAALAFARQRQASATQIRKLLLSKTTRLKAMGKAKQTRTFGRGLLDLKKLLG